VKYIKQQKPTLKVRAALKNNNISEMTVLTSYFHFSSIPTLSPFRKEKKPSLFIYDNGDKVIITDYGDKLNRNIYSFLSLYLFNTEQAYFKVLNIIIRDFKLKIPYFRADIPLVPKKKPLNIKAIKSTKTPVDVKYIIRNDTTSLYEYFRPLGVSKDILELYDIKSIKELYVGDYCIKSRLIIAFPLHGGVKFYSPYKLNKHLHKCNKNAVFGLNQLDKSKLNTTTV